ncbi:FAD-binding oxidoreductase [Paenibacillus sp. N1-5-1-14]|uniref:FAD-binding oxidoreductase n=1 Tax=Paenibacillus radicibacter TaxID=2972488 RepID=UPI0021592BAE|nr:FAD-binding oxidoreductase [Paenibacillus radicibacter]MCR8643243.1 FAD-binding oxidoreductase [Paenibacillus radicibacter]
MIKHTLIADNTIQLLTHQLTGTIIQPNDPAYEEARHIWNLATDAYPNAIVQVKNAQDIAATLKWAQQQQFDIAVRGAGHSFAGYSAGHGRIVIDLSDLKQIELDVATRITRIQPGATWGDVVEVLQPHGLAITSGDNATVGVGGLAQGSGIGFMVRKYGLAIDRLLAVELVTADGEMVRASKDENSELFWGLRGGAGNFGIVTSMEFSAHDAGDIYGGFVFYEGTNAEELAQLGLMASEAPEELTTLISIMTTMEFPFIDAKYYGKPALGVLFVYTGDVAEGERVLAPFLQIGNVIGHTLGLKMYPELMERLGAERVGYISRNLYLKELNLQAAEMLVKDINESPFPPFSAIQLRVIGGAVSRIADDATAYSHRNKPYLVLLQNIYVAPEMEVALRTLSAKVWETIKPLSAGAEANFLGSDELHRISEVYTPDKLERLSELKKQYDPNNLFASNLNIAPTP